MPLIQPIVTASGGSNFVPQTRILTINGVSYDLSADRTWTVEVLDNLIATAPLSYSSGTNTISISQSSASADGYLSSADWLTFSSKQPALTLTTTGNSGASTLVGATLNVPEYTLAGLGGFSNPMTSLGDIIYGNAVGLALRRAGNTTTTKMFLSQTGDGTISAAPTWATAVTSVALTMPSAFSVTGSPITTTGTLAVTALGSASQYIRGDGVLATLPTGGSGGSSVSYYLNGGTAASVGTYYQMSTTAVVGANADFTRTGNGLISQFLTDAGDPNRLQIPAGNWNFEMFFSMSSNGGTPEFYVELLKYDGTTFTSIASSSAIPEVINGGTIIDLYLTSLAIPATTLLATDRLALRVYIVNNSGGRTATLHTQDSHLCQIITNFAGGVSALNGLTANTQYFAVGTSGSDFNISSVTDTHTFNLPSASASVRGALLSADWSTFNGKMANVFTSLGDMVYSNAGGAPVRRSGNITTTKMFLSQTGDGTTSAAPQWSVVTATDVGAITSLTGEATGSGSGAVAVTLTNSAVIGKVLTGLNVTGGSVVSTDTILQGFGKLQNQVNGLVGGVMYQGTWNASTNSPTLTSSAGTKGYYYVVSVAGSTNLNGVADWKIGDWAIYNGITWEKVDNTDSVTSVNGFTGAVTLITSNVAEGTNLYYTEARVDANTNVAANTAARHNALTIGTANGLSLSTQVLSLALASTSVTGALDSTDWNTFNNKMNNVFTSLGDMVYSNAGGLAVRRSGNITTTKMFLSQTGDGTTSAAPQWSAVTAADTGSVPTSRTLTINDVVFDLSADRSYSIGDYGTW